MSLEVTSNIENPKVSILYSNIVELIAIINVLADPKHHASVQKEVKNLSIQLSANSKKFLQKVSGLPYQGIEIYMLIVARALQGSGAVMTIAYSWIGDDIENDKKSSAMGIAGVIVAICAVIAFVVGPLLYKIISVKYCS
ncbi:MFS family permease [Clostridium algifaecis]|uniref:MFS family permease n=1 Tax=Clostridium algifaecis TaxID=1472040 RepID=A0ABS4KV57_9CLOT|nr:hypothetical protein [Clostridium algifaecis]MBP2033893.1 MFS family permease [Clostridium algifaecis]